MSRPVEFLTDRPVASKRVRDKEDAADDGRPADRDCKVNYRFGRKTSESSAHYRGAAPEQNPQNNKSRPKGSPASPSTPARRPARAVDCHRNGVSRPLRRRKRDYARWRSPKSRLTISQPGSRRRCGRRQHRRDCRHDMTEAAPAVVLPRMPNGRMLSTGPAGAERRNSCPESSTSH